MFEFEPTPDDLADFFRVDEASGRRQTRRWKALALCVAFWAFHATWAAVGDPPDLSFLDIFAAGLFLRCLVLIVWQSPRRLARRAWSRQADLRGHIRAEAGPAGIVTTEADGRRTEFPWSAIAALVETPRGHLVLGAGGEVVTALLPHRGLADPSLVGPFQMFAARMLETTADGAAARS